MSGGNIYVDGRGVVRDCSSGHRIEGIELLEKAPAGGGRVGVNLTHPVLTDEDGKVDGVDMTVAENRRRLHNEMAGITEDDEKELKGRMSNQKQYKAFVFYRDQKMGKKWKYEAKVGKPLDPNVVHPTAKFPLGSRMVTLEGKDPE